MVLAFSKLYHIYYDKIFYKIPVSWVIHYLFYAGYPAGGTRAAFIPQP